MIAATFLFAAAVAVQPLDCDNAMTQADMNRCAYQDFERADADMNAQWKVTADQLKIFDRDSTKDGRPGYFDALLAAQRAWLSYRDAHCRSEGYVMRGGSAEPMLISGCKATLTRQRTEQLRSLADEY